LPGGTIRKSVDTGFDPATLSVVKPTDLLPKSLYFDPFSIIDNLGFKERSKSIAYSSLRGIPLRVPAIGAIFNLRTKQMEAFGKPQKDPYSMGYKINLRDTKKQPTAAAFKRIRELETFIYHTGAREDNKSTDNFTTFLHKPTIHI